MRSDANGGRKFGNSSGVIIPKSLLRDLGMAEGHPVETTLEAGRIFLVPIKRRARAGWAEASQRIAEARNDALEFGNLEDENLIRRDGTALPSAAARFGW